MLTPDAAEELITAGQVPPALDAVAAAAGVSKGGLLYHFDKQSLLRALVTRALQRFDERLTAAAADGLGAAAAVAIVGARAGRAHGVPGDDVDDAVDRHGRAGSAR